MQVLDTRPLKAAIQARYPLPTTPEGSVDTRHADYGRLRDRQDAELKLGMQAVLALAFPGNPKSRQQGMCPHCPGATRINVFEDGSRAGCIFCGGRFRPEPGDEGWNDRVKFWAVNGITSCPDSFAVPEYDGVFITWGPISILDEPEVVAEAVATAS